MMNGAPERDNDQKGIGRSWEEQGKRVRYRTLHTIEVI
jgi:hypothetical protein